MSLVAEHAPSRQQVVAVLAGRGAIGLFFGVVPYPSWSDALEPAQVLAGLVSYSPHNPVYLYSARTWTVLHQVLALFLSWGFSERPLTLMLSGVSSSRADAVARRYRAA